MRRAQESTENHGEVPQNFRGTLCLPFAGGPVGLVWKGQLDRTTQSVRGPRSALFFVCYLPSKPLDVTAAGVKHEVDRQAAAYVLLIRTDGRSELCLLRWVAPRLNFYGGSPLATGRRDDSIPEYRDRRYAKMRGTCRGGGDWSEAPVLIYHGRSPLEAAVRMNCIEVHESSTSGMDAECGNGALEIEYGPPYLS